MADGVYTYHITPYDPVTQVYGLEATGTIEVDNEAPNVIISSPSQDDIIWGINDIEGTASDTNFTSYRVEYGVGASPSSWTLITEGTSEVTSGVLASWTTFGLGNELHSLRLSCEDAAGNVSSQTITVTIDNVLITNVSITPSSFNPSNDETVSISYNIDRDADITISIFNSENTVVRTLIENASRQGGQNAEAWDGKDDGNVIVEPDGYLFRIEANSGRGLYDQEFSYVRNDSILSEFSITTPFNPYSGQLCGINYTLSDKGRVRIGVGREGGRHEVGQWLVHDKFLPAGSYTAYWDGRDLEGNILDYDTIVAAYKGENIPENTIIVISDEDIQINVTSDAYSIIPSYGDISDIEYTIPVDGIVTVKIYDGLDNLVKTLVDHESHTAGTYSLVWDGTNTAGKLVANEDTYDIVIELFVDETSVIRKGAIIVD